MTRVASELTQFVSDLRTIAAELHDPGASLLRVPLALASTRAFQPDSVQSVVNESAPRDGLAITCRARGIDTRRSRS